MSSPAGSGAEPQPKSNLVHLALKMRSGGNDFNYFKLTKLANFVQFKRMLMFCLENWRGAGPLVCDVICSTSLLEGLCGACGAKSRRQVGYPGCVGEQDVFSYKPDR